MKILINNLKFTMILKINGLNCRAQNAFVSIEDIDVTSKRLRSQQEIHIRNYINLKNILCQEKLCSLV